MPYLLLALGFIAAAFGLYRLFISSSTIEVKSVIFYVFIAVLVGCLIFLAVTGRLLLSIAGIIVLTIIFFRMWFIRKKRQQKNSNDSDDNDGPPLIE